MRGSTVWRQQGVLAPVTADRAVHTARPLQVAMPRITLPSQATPAGRATRLRQGQVPRDTHHQQALLDWGVRAMGRCHHRCKPLPLPLRITQAFAQHSGSRTSSRPASFLSSQAVSLLRGRTPLAD
jgi:hypothetical protein